MPVEKLTSKRLIQIIVVLVILIGVFFYRTYTYNQENKKGSAVDNPVIFKEIKPLGNNVTKSD